MFSIVKRLDPKGLELRTADKNRRKGEYIVPGPDYIWSIDGHEKLSPFGASCWPATLRTGSWWAGAAARAAL